MKWPARILDTVRIRHRSGMSLVELVIVLGISTALIGGSFAWFRSRGGTVFYDQMRQIDSFARQVQSEADSQHVVGFDTNPGCKNSSNRATAPPTPCPLLSNEQVFGTALIANIPAPTGTTTLTSVRLKRDTFSTPNIVSFGTGPSFTLDAGVRFSGWATSNASSNCNTADPGWPVPAASWTTFSGIGTQMAIVFRQQPRAVYTASNFTTTPAPLLSNYGVDDPITATPALRPCSALMRFESKEQISAGVPRYTAEVHIQPTFGTMRLQTR